MADHGFFLFKGDILIPTPKDDGDFVGGGEFLLRIAIDFEGYFSEVPDELIQGNPLLLWVELISHEDVVAPEVVEIIWVDNRFVPIMQDGVEEPLPIGRDVGFHAFGNETMVFADERIKGG